MSDGDRGQRRFAIFVDPSEERVDLTQWKVYEVLDDSEAEGHGQFRVVDESGEDYLYPQDWFHLIELPAEIAKLY